MRFCRNSSFVPISAVSKEREIIRNNYQLQESEMDLLKSFDGSTFGEIEEVIKRFSIDSAFRIS